MQLLGCGSMPRLNEDIVDKTDICPMMLPHRLQHLDIKLKSDLGEHKDYEFVNEEGWQVLKRYDNYEVKRWVVDTFDGQKVELYYQQLKLIPLWNNLLKDEAFLAQ